MQRVIWEERPHLRDPIAVLAFEGWGDAGEASTGAAAHLVDSTDAVRVGVIDCDDFFDFQVRRPLVELDESGVRRVLWPDTEIWEVPLPAGDRDLLVITGHEPHARWKAFSADILTVLETLDVREAITLGAFAGQVPHTLPVPLIGSSADPVKLDSLHLMSSNYEGPTGIVGVLNQVMVDAGISTVSVWAAVPHYLANQEYPPAALALTEKVLDVVGFGIDLSDLTVAAAEFREQVDVAMEDSEIRDYVADLESQSLTGEEGIDPGERLLSEIEDYLRDS